MKWPATAAAAAISGETRWVRPPFPIRPSKLRLLVPAHRSSPSYVKNTAVGALVGFVLICGLLCLKEIFTAQEDIMIHSSEELADLFPDYPVLAVVPDLRNVSKKGYYSDYNAYYGNKVKEAK